MKVLVAGARFDRSEKALLRLLAERGVKVDVIFDPDAPEYELFSEDGIPSDGLVFSSRLDRKAVRYLRYKIESGGYDIVHSLTNRALSNSIIAAGDSVRHVAYRGTIGHLSRWDPASWMTYFNPKVSRIICVSDAVREYLLRMKIPAERLKTIYKGHDLKWYEGGADELPSEFGIPGGVFTVGYTGGFRPVKGLEHLIRAAALLKGTGIHFLLFGDGRLEEKLKSLVASLELEDIVHFAGFRDDAKKLVAACDAFVMPSVEREGLPRGVIEAMAQGVPAVVSDVGGMPEIVEHEKNGLVVPPKDPAALADAVKKLSGNRELLGTYGTAARARISEKFDIKTTFKRTLELYEEVLG